MLQQTPRTSDIDNGEWSHLAPDAGEMAARAHVVDGGATRSMWWSCKSALCMRRSVCCSPQTSPSIQHVSAKRRWHPLLHAEVLHFRGRGDRERSPFKPSNKVQSMGRHERNTASEVRRRLSVTQKGCASARFFFRCRSPNPVA